MKATLIICGVMVWRYMLINQVTRAKPQTGSIGAIGFWLKNASDPYEKRAGPAMNSKEKKKCEETNLLPVTGTNLYLPTNNSMFSWRSSHQCCQMKNFALVSEPLKYKDALFKIIKGGDYLWTSATDVLNENEFEWETGEDIPEIWPWHTNEPNGEDRENCCIVYPTGLMNDGQCPFAEVKFLCEKIAPPGGDKPSPEDINICKSIEFADVGDKFKKQKNVLKSLVNWPTAAACCRSRGWELANLDKLTKKEEKLLFEGSEEWKFWTSGNDLIKNDTFKWGNSQEIELKNKLWYKNNPQTLYTTRHCVQIWKSKTAGAQIKHVSCNLKRFVLCEKSVDNCCRANDTKEIVNKVSKNKLEFFPPAKLLEEMELMTSVVQQLSPSSVTGKNWTQVVEDVYFPSKVGSGENPKLNTTEPPPQSTACITSFYIWHKLVAKCRNISVVYYDNPIIIYDNVSCYDQIKCEPICNATDKWVLHATHETILSVFQGGSAPLNKSKPCFEFEPALDPNDFLNAQIYNELRKTLSPSHFTGVDWQQYYTNVTNNIPPIDYVVKKGEVQPGFFLNIYHVRGSCGPYNVTIPVYKKVLFKTGEADENCRIAKNQSVPLKNC